MMYSNYQLPTSSAKENEIIPLTTEEESKPTVVRSTSVSNQYSQHQQILMHRKQNSEIQKAIKREQNISKKYSKICELSKRKSKSLNTSIKANRDYFQNKIAQLENKAADMEFESEKKRTQILKKIEYKQKETMKKKMEKTEKLKMKAAQNQNKSLLVKNNLIIEQTLLKSFISKVVEKTNTNTKKKETMMAQKSLLEQICENERKYHLKCN